MSKRRSHLYFDSEMAYLQQRIYLHRLSLKLSVQDAERALRERFTSPSALLGAATTGFVLERLTRRTAPDRPSTSNRLLGIFTHVARTGLKFLQSAPGFWLATHFVSRGQQQPEGERGSRQANL